MKDRKQRVAKLTSMILVLSLALSSAYAIVRMIAAPTVSPESATYVKTKSDYALVLVQCLLGLLVSLLPSILARRWMIILPHTIYNL